MNLYDIEPSEHDKAPLNERGAIRSWERFVNALQAISARPVALRIRDWSDKLGAPVWEIITPEVEFASGTKFYTPPTPRGVGTTPREAVEDFMSFAAASFSRGHVIAIFCRDTDRGNHWAFYRWDTEGEVFIEATRPTPDPEPSRPALL